MTTSQPPEFYFDGINFNPEFFEDVSATLTKKECDARYLIKTETDIASALETFNVGIKTNSIEPINATDTLNINTVSSTATNIINIGNNTTNEQTLNLNSKTINMGDTSVPSSVNILSASVIIGTPSGTISFGSSAPNNQITPSTSTLTINTISPYNGDFNLCPVQNSGILNIGTSPLRTAAINIATAKNTSAGQAINIGSSNVLATNQFININRPLTIGYTVSPSSITQIGGTLFIDAVGQPYGSTGETLTLAVINSIPIGIYQVFYNISTTITVATAIITERTIAVSNTTADVSVANTINFMRDSDLLHQTRIVGHNITVSGGGIFVNTTSSVSIFLCQRYIFSAGPTVIGTGHLRIVRIG